MSAWKRREVFGLPRINLLAGPTWMGKEIPPHKFSQRSWYGSGLLQPEASGANYCWVNGGFEIDNLPMPRWLTNHVNEEDTLRKTAEIAFPMGEPNASLEILKSTIKELLYA